MVVAGMEGALPSVVGGYVACPVIAVPTSVGYGASFGGVAALLAMLNSCASNVSVVNIDAGFKGGYVAGLIAKKRRRREEERARTETREREFRELRKQGPPLPPGEGWGEGDPAEIPPFGFDRASFPHPGTDRGLVAPGGRGGVVAFDYGQCAGVEHERRARRTPGPPARAR